MKTNNSYPQQQTPPKTLRVLDAAFLNDLDARFGDYDEVESYISGMLLEAFVLGRNYTTLEFLSPESAQQAMEALRHAGHTITLPKQDFVFARHDIYQVEVSWSSSRP